MEYIDVILLFVGIVYCIFGTGPRVENVHPLIMAFARLMAPGPLISMSVYQKLMERD